MDEMHPTTRTAWMPRLPLTPSRLLLVGLSFLCSFGLLSACSSETAKEAIGKSNSVPSVASIGEMRGTDPESPLSQDQTAPTVAPTPLSSRPAPSPSGTADGGFSSTSTSLPSPDLTDSVGPPSVVSGSEAGVRLAAAARTQVGVTTGYDPAYVSLSFPGGDVDAKTGVCSDVVIRALRVLGIDLQARLNLDMKAHFSEYPTKWGLASPDTNIDHRRVPNLATYFARRGYEQPVTNDPADYQPGDIVWIKLPLDHIGIVSDRTVEGRPLLIHNVGQGAKEEDVLFSWRIVGHYRVVS
jgi:uncharacterized protein